MSGVSRELWLLPRIIADFQERYTSTSHRRLQHLITLKKWAAQWKRNVYMLGNSSSLISTLRGTSCAISEWGIWVDLRICTLRKIVSLLKCECFSLIYYQWLRDEKESECQSCEGQVNNERWCVLSAAESDMEQWLPLQSRSSITEKCAARGTAYLIK